MVALAFGGIGAPLALGAIRGLVAGLGGTKTFVGFFQRTEVDARTADGDAKSSAARRTVGVGEEASAVVAPATHAASRPIGNRGATANPFDASRLEAFAGVRAIGRGDAPAATPASPILRTAVSATAIGVLPADGSGTRAGPGIGASQPSQAEGAGHQAGEQTTTGARSSESTS